MSRHLLREFNGDNIFEEELIQRLNDAKNIPNFYRPDSIADQISFHRISFLIDPLSIILLLSSYITLPIHPCPNIEC